MSERKFVAFDLGASSGRTVAGILRDGKLELDILNRFTNGPVRMIDHIHWPILGIFRDLLEGLKVYSSKYGADIDGMGCDTWGVDYGLLAENGELLGLPYHYRDSRTDRMPEKLFSKVSSRNVYKNTGIQIMSINTLFQIYSQVLENDPALEKADKMLFMPDLLNYFFTGEKVCEYSIATTSQMYDTENDCWATGMLEELGIPTRILPEVIAPGSVVGNLLDSIAGEVGIKSTAVLAPACHDTGSAVAAVPATQGDDWCYISSGTWSLMGVEVASPVISKRSRELNFTNEGGVDGTIRLLKNIMGMWLTQELKRAWVREGDTSSWDELEQMAVEAKPFKVLLDLDYAPFASPGNMPQKVVDYCRETGQPTPQTKGEFMRAAFEALAIRYAETLDSLEELVGKELSTIHIVGGGIQNKILNRFAAAATGRRVVTGPVEATAAGNILMQAIGVGAVGSLAEAREIVRNSFEMESFEPGDKGPWDEARARFAKIKNV